MRPTGMPIKDLRGYLKPDEVQRIIEASPTPRDRLLIQTLWITGARISEVIDREHGIRPQDLVIDGGENIIIMRTLKRSRKKNPTPPPSRRVPIPKKLMDSLQAFCINTPAQMRIFPISRQRAFEIVRRAGKLAGITQVGEKRLHPHHLRHSHCVAYIKHDNTLEGLKKLQRRLGHASFATTAHYLQFSMKGEAKKIEEIFG